MRHKYTHHLAGMEHDASARLPVAFPRLWIENPVAGRRNEVLLRCEFSVSYIN